MSKLKTFHFVYGGNRAGLYEDYQTTRAAIADAVQQATVEPIKLYRVLEDDEEYLLFDSEKCNDRTIDGILKWAEKGGRS